MTQKRTCTTPKCVYWGGPDKRYEIGSDTHMLEYDPELDSTYPWSFIKIVNGRLTSGQPYCWKTQTAAMHAFKSGEELFA